MTRDRGSIDSIETLVGAIFLIAFMLFIIETTAYWHGRNIYDAAAAEGVRQAAAFDGDCGAAQAAAAARVEQQNKNWASGLSVSCSRTDTEASVTVSGQSIGVLFGSNGFEISVTETAPVER